MGLTPSSSPLTQISEVTEDKAIYDAREKAIRNHQWELNASHDEGIAEGKIEGKIETIRILQDILQLPPSPDSDFEGKTLEELQQLTAELQVQIRNRRSPE